MRVDLNMTSHSNSSNSFAFTFPTRDACSHWLSLIHYFSSSCNVSITAKGVYVELMDDAHVMLMRMTLVPSWFDSFSCAHHRTIGLSVGKLLTLVKKMPSLATVTFSQPYGTDDEVQLVFDDTHRRATFDCKLLDLEKKDSLQDPIYPKEHATLVLTTSSFDACIQPFSMYDKTAPLHFHATSHNIVLSSNEYNSGRLRIPLVETQHTDAYTFTCTKPVSVCHNLRYFISLIKLLKCQRIRLTCANNFVTCLTLEQWTPVKKDVHNDIRIYISPMTTDDDNDSDTERDNMVIS